MTDPQLNRANKRGRKFLMPIALLVDDDDGIREIATLCLRSIGFTVHTAKNGKDASKLFRATVPDVVITDLMMPEQDGLETIIELRKLNPKIKIIAMSGGGRMSLMDVLNLAKKLGATATLAKPFSMDELRLAITDVLAAPPLEGGSS